MLQRQEDLVEALARWLEVAPRTLAPVVLSQEQQRRLRAAIAAEASVRLQVERFVAG